MALVGYEQEKTRIDAQIADIHSRLGTANPSFTVTAGTAPKKRRLSVAARKRISAATTARWLAYRKAKAEAEKPSEKTKRKLSAAGLRAIREATAKRWAAYRKTQKAAVEKKTPVAKKATPKPKARKPGEGPGGFDGSTGPGDSVTDWPVAIILDGRHEW
jgi:hypothetical protein